MYFSSYLTYLSAVVTFLTVFCENVASAEDCGQDELAACARPLQVLAETSELSFVTQKAELDKLCPDLRAGLHCIRSYTRRCMSMNQRTHFNKLYHGTGEVIHELCEEGPYQEDFLRHAPCMRHVKSEYELCSKRYQNTMAKIAAPDEPRQLQQQQQQQNHHHHQRQQHNDAQQHHHNFTMLADAVGDAEESGDNGEQPEGVKAVCCAFKEYIACSESTVQRTCGTDAAFFTRSFLDKISSSLMRMHCEGFRPIPGRCGEPTTSAATTLSMMTPIASILTTITLLLVMKLN